GLMVTYLSPTRRSRPAFRGGNSSRRCRKRQNGGLRMGPMKISVTRILLMFQVFQGCAFATNSVVNLSHYDLMRVDFERMKSEGIVGVIHEATYPRFDRDSYYGARQEAATRAGLFWGAYHFGDATDPVRQADHFLTMVASQWHDQDVRPGGVLLVLDFEKNDHYPGGTMRVDQAVTFVERIRQRTGK